MCLTKSGIRLYSRTVDRDEFTKATRLGGAASRSIRFALEGENWTEAPCRRLFEVVLSREIPSLGPVFACAQEIGEADLFPVAPFEAMDAIDRASREVRGASLDVVVREEAMRSVAEGRCSPGDIASRFVDRLTARFIFDCRGGLRESYGDEYVRTNGPEIHRLLGPILTEAAALLFNRPDAVIRRLTTGYYVTADTDLLGGGAT
jgi:hypothetical protein